MATAAVRDEKCAICDKILGKNDKEELLVTQCGHTFHLICVRRRLNKKKTMNCKVKDCHKESALMHALNEYEADMWKRVSREGKNQIQSRKYASCFHLPAVSNNTSL
jgi:hypothetical protein